MGEHPLVRRRIGKPKDDAKCSGWNVWLGSCELPAGHSGAHKDKYGDDFRSSPRKR